MCTSFGEECMFFIEKICYIFFWVFFLGGGGGGFFLCSTCWSVGRIFFYRRTFFVSQPTKMSCMLLKQAQETFIYYPRGQGLKYITYMLQIKVFPFYFIILFFRKAMMTTLCKCGQQDEGRNVSKTSSVVTTPSSVLNNSE